MVMTSDYLIFGLIQGSEIAFVCYVPLLSELRLEKIFRNNVLFFLLFSNPILKLLDLNSFTKSNNLLFISETKKLLTNGLKNSPKRSLNMVSMNNSGPSEKLAREDLPPFTRSKEPLMIKNLPSKLSQKQTLSRHPPTGLLSKTRSTSSNWPIKRIF